jgi:hypothetical protein
MPRFPRFELNLSEEQAWLLGGDLETRVCGFDLEERQ